MEEDFPSLTSTIRKITKTDGTIVNFEPQKIAKAIYNAASNVGIENTTKALTIAKEIISQLELNFHEKTPTTPLTTEEVNNTLERVLMENGEVQVAKAYILYRHKKSEEQERRAFILGEWDPAENLLFSNQALKILEKRYLLKDKDGQLLETPKGMLQRVAKNIAEADKYYGANKEEVKETEEKFYQMMAELRFLPNSPTLMNADTKVQQLSSCFVLPIEDTMQGIFGSLKDAALIHKRGSGTGFAFSRLRPKGDSVKDNMGVASGSGDFLRVYDSAFESIKQGGVRKGANMAVLRVDHPDIIR